MNGLTRRRYFFWPIMLILVSVFCWQYFKPQPEPRIDPVRHVQIIPTIWATGDPSDIPPPKRYIKEDKLVNGRLEVHGRVEVYRDGKWIEVLPAK